MRCAYEGKIFAFIGLHHTKTSCFVIRGKLLGINYKTKKRLFL